MPIPRLRPADTTLLIIDVQERLMPTIHAADAVVRHAGVLCRAAPLLDMPVVVTEQYVKGLGHTVPALRETFPATATVVEKTRFSAVVPGVTDALRATRRPSVLVCGVEAHVCVLQTVLDLLTGGWVVFLATDAISAGQPSQVAPALRRMERAGAVPTGTLSALYELMGDAQHPQFKAVLPMAKMVRDA